MREHHMTQNYCPLHTKDENIKTYFRKCADNIRIRQFNKDGLLIGQLRISSEQFEAICGAPTLPTGDTNTQQALETRVLTNK